MAKTSKKKIEEKKVEETGKTIAKKSPAKKTPASRTVAKKTSPAKATQAKPASSTKKTTSKSVESKAKVENKSSTTKPTAKKTTSAKAKNTKTNASKKSTSSVKTDNTKKVNENNSTKPVVKKEIVKKDNSKKEPVKRRSTSKAKTNNEVDDASKVAVQNEKTSPDKNTTKKKVTTKSKKANKSTDVKKSINKDESVNKTTISTSTKAEKPTPKKTTKKVVNKSIKNEVKAPENKKEIENKNINNSNKKETASSQDKPVRELKLVLRSELEEIEKNTKIKDKSSKIQVKVPDNKKIDNKKELNSNSKTNNNNNKTNKNTIGTSKNQQNKNTNSNKTTNNTNKTNSKSSVNNQNENKSNANNKKELNNNNSKNNNVNLNKNNNKVNQNTNNKNNQKNINKNNVNNNIKKEVPKIDIEEYFKSGAYIIKGKENKKNNKAKNNKKENHLKINEKYLLSFSQKRDSYYKKIYSEIEDFVTKDLYLDDDIKIVVGVSGGVDSVVLLDIIANLSSRKDLILFVAHVDHGLRKESGNDVEFVKKLCSNYNIRFFTKKVNVKEYANKKKISVEESARELRYEFFEEVCANTGSSFLALAHNSNDSAETFFINLLRGTGLSGLAGIPQKRPLNTQVNIIRPLINLSRADIEEYAKKRNITWVEDITNKENIYLRNKIRNELLPFIQEKFDRDIIASINKASKLINSADVFIYHKIKKYLNEVLIEKKVSYVEIDLKKLFLFDDFIKGELLNLILKNIFELKNISQNIIKGILNLYFSEPGAIFEINPKITAYKDRESLFIARNQLFRNNSLVIDNLGEFRFENKIFKLTKVPKTKVELGESDNIEYFDMDYMPDKLEIRHIQDGDKFTPIGMTGRIKINDFLTNNKIPLLKKKDILLLTDRVNIMWVCGHRIADKYKLKPNTKKVLKVEIIDKNS